jgi:hypothetical protein
MEAMNPSAVNDFLKEAGAKARANSQGTFADIANPRSPEIETGVGSFYSIHSVPAPDGKRRLGARASNILHDFAEKARKSLLPRRKAGDWPTRYPSP